MGKTDLNRETLRRFGIIMGLGFLAISFVILIRGRQSAVPALALSLAFFICSALFTPLLRPVYTLWMKLAFALGWLNTRLILIAIFYLLFTPLGLIMRLFGMDLLDKKIDRRQESYWRKREKKEFNRADYERLF